MRRLLVLLAVCGLAILPVTAVAGDYHTGATLVCSDCHVMHGSQAHPVTAGGFFTPIGPAAPYNDLLRNEVNELCLTCHDGSSLAPDVFGANGGVAMVRRGGGLNAAAGHRANDTGYDDIDGHTLWSTATAPGGTFASTEGLGCADCHSVHGSATNYRNMKTSTRTTSTWYNKLVTYAIGTNDLNKDVYERSAAAYSDADVDFNEPDITNSAYGKWCQVCHTNFHGVEGATNMGGGATPWVRHPTAGVDLSSSRLTQFNSHTNRVKMMDSQGLWDGTAADNTVTPSCFSCHRSHGDKNGFGLIFMAGTGTVTEEGDNGTTVKELCRQCHTQGG